MLHVNIGKKKCKKAFLFFVYASWKYSFVQFRVFSKNYIFCCPLASRIYESEDRCGTIKHVTAFKMYKSLLNDVAKCGHLFVACNWLSYLSYFYLVCSIYIESKYMCGKYYLKIWNFIFFFCDFLSRIM